jgi:hypothetical protein
MSSEDWQSYLTHDNGSRPFLVQIDSKGEVLVMTEDPAEKDRRLEDWLERGLKYDEEDAKKFTQPVLFVQASQIWVGRSDPTENDHPGGDWGTGNSILLETQPLHYTFVGDRVYSFETVEPIVALHSPIGNNDVPYPVAESENFYYFLLDFEWLTKEGFQTTPGVSDLYYHYYGHSGVRHTSQRGPLLNKREICARQT